MSNNLFGKSMSSNAAYFVQILKKPGGNDRAATNAINTFNILKRKQ